ncbi:MULTISPECIES: antirepressor AbbA [Priestia]|jgi:hypothetical protein|uniref:Recombinase XerD n=3 Tax=Priestia TaxID=2800373 RepID=A0A0H4KD57_9BACI|nr:MULTISPECIES: antirepressor AbbA [Priestia]AKO91540.1 recombinase XerD [Priestia filamentosa]KAB2496204.1 antirepressor AbbA [Priestia endophytica]KYG31418.1 recombinase XerD [Priestia endophytica]MBG9811714.1 recombinase XerD [Priestia endophytica]MCM3536851.1 antirepressor AbbA [Priestia endophytica]
MKATASLAKEEEQLLLHILFEQGYALEVVSSHLVDIEHGLKTVETKQYQEIASLYSRLRELS